MMKKFKLINLMSLALTALATVVIIIACGKGIPDDIGDFDNHNTIESSKTFLKNNMKNEDFMSSVTMVRSSSSKPVSSSSAKGGSSSGNASGSSSSNVGGNSSGANQGSSSGGASLYNLTCEITGTGTEKVRLDISKITKVKCVAKSSPNVDIPLDADDDFTWSTEPKLDERSPAVGAYSIQVEVDENANACQGLKADCGTLTVVAAVSSSSAAVSSSSRASSSSAAVSSSSAAVSSSSRASSSSAAVSSSSRASSSSAAASSSSVAVTLTCVWPSPIPTTGTAAANNGRAYLRCSNNNTAPTAGTVTWSGTPRAPIASNAWASAGSYTGITVSVTGATCGTATGVSGSSISCSNITIPAPATPSSSSVAPSSSSVVPSSSSIPSSSSVAPSSSSASGNPTTINTTETPFPVGSYQVSFTVSGATTFRCYIKPGQAGDRNIGTYTPSGGSATNIIIGGWQTQTEPISLGITSGSGTGTFNITTADVTCKISY
ncbi:MAG: hypothetical protein LBC87_11810 [Fibromonadaceae bacterium]|nr:hypothetical protein [Fibromonadaceae bacterium]